jgi:hypothetical protein
LASGSAARGTSLGAAGISGSGITSKGVDLIDGATLRHTFWSSGEEVASSGGYHSQGDDIDDLRVDKVSLGTSVAGLGIGKSAFDAHFSEWLTVKNDSLAKVDDGPGFNVDPDPKGDGLLMNQVTFST